MRHKAKLIALQANLKQVNQLYSDLLRRFGVGNFRHSVGDTGKENVGLFLETDALDGSV